MDIYDKNNNVIGKYENCTITDLKGRKHMSIKPSGDIVLERYVNTSSCLKKQVSILYNELTGQSIEETMRFLNFEDELFCS
jgi:hypothetical protein